MTLTPIAAVILLVPVVGLVGGRNRLKVFVSSPQGVIGSWVKVVLASGTAVTLGATKVIGGRREADAIRDVLNDWLRPTH